MALIGVEVTDPGGADRGRVLSERLGVPVLERFGDEGTRLIVGPHEVALGFNDRRLGKPFAVDFLSPEWRRRLHKPLARGHIFRRAIGECTTFVDATAGFGGDAVLVLKLGVAVTAIERSPAVAALLADGVARARRDDPGLDELLGCLTLVNDDAAAYLAAARDAAERPDVVYLDPMFTKLKAKAKSPKEMQLLQDLLPPATEADDARLFMAARAAAGRRVVVKRALKARALGEEPTHSFKGQSVRYDVYVRA